MFYRIDTEFYIKNREYNGEQTLSDYRARTLWRRNSAREFRAAGILQ